MNKQHVLLQMIMRVAEALRHGAPFNHDSDTDNCYRLDQQGGTFQ